MGEALSTSGAEKLAERAAPAWPPQACPRSDDLVSGVPGHQAGVSLPQGPFGAAAATEVRLGRYLSERRAELAALDAEADALLGEPLAALALRGGRRIRACFVWLGWLAAGSPPERAEPAALAAAVELLQLCALVHDDIMDASRTRRGALSLHEQFAAHHRAHALSGDPVRYGQARALLAGDLALLWAEDLYRQASSDLAGRAATDAVWRAMRTEMVAGQNLDLVLQAEQSSSTAAALRVAELKTARYSIERPLHLGATAAGADAEAVLALRAFGRRVGVAFQLRDDLLGSSATPRGPANPVATTSARANARSCSTSRSNGPRCAATRRPGRCSTSASAAPV
ncbi:polyprenyl synthetase family protein [Streptacidiphilus sp. N1-12]|uniref:Polyprenyl synthetase family protein n=2 Tax=Streptacidiphilus alkalitolerans TaxID=3342712 RepID=A0ABV6W8P3_9ACTN